MIARSPNFQKVREDSSGYLLQILSRRSDKVLRDRLEGIELDPKLFANLMVIAERDGINQKQLGEKLDEPEYSTSRSIDALIKGGYVERQPDPNSRRTVLIFLTDSGRNKALLLPDIVNEVNEINLQNLNPDEKKSLIGLLQKAVGLIPL